jgi:hypothetical protein
MKHELAHERSRSKEVCFNRQQEALRIKGLTLETITIPAHFKWWAKMGYSASGVVRCIDTAPEAIMHPEGQSL